MKILEPGTKDRWWHGAKLKCYQCGQIVELEAGDEATRHFIWASNTRVEVCCSNCSAVNVHYAPPEHDTATLDDVFRALKNAVLP